ncbi:YncE family protein, partial [Streptomyces sp. NPDC002870]
MSGIAVRGAPKLGSPQRSRGGSWWVVVRAWVAGVAVLAGLALPVTLATPAAAQTGTFAYVANSADDTVSVIDT